MLRLGWDVASLPQPYVDLGRDARALAAQARGFIDEPTPGLALELLEGAGEAYRAMSALPAPDGADQAQFTAEIGERLFELLLGDHLQAELPVVLALLEILGLAELELHPADGDRPAYGRLRLAWHELPAVLADAGGRILDRYRWGMPRSSPGPCWRRFCPCAPGRESSSGWARRPHPSPPGTPPERRPAPRPSAMRCR